jgi:His/Glu/Gln/Arg/opine family amino acid ABC transporter permease subunit
LSPVAQAGGIDMGASFGGLDLSFVNWEIISKFVVNGFWFSVQLTIIATLGGIALGTVLALMRLSGSKALAIPATIYVNGMRSIPLVMVILGFFLLMPFLIGRPIGAELSAIITFVAFEAAYSVHPAWASTCGTGCGYDLQPKHAPDCVATSLS